MPIGCVRLSQPLRAAACTGSRAARSRTMRKLSLPLPMTIVACSSIVGDRPRPGGNLRWPAGCAGDARALPAGSHRRRDTRSALTPAASAAPRKVIAASRSARSYSLARGRPCRGRGTPRACTPRSAARTVSGSLQVERARTRASGCSRRARSRSRVPPTTLAPVRARAASRCEPTNPVAPVTRIRRGRGGGSCPGAIHLEEWDSKNHASRAGPPSMRAVA